MTETLNVLFLAAEAEPFFKVGGLADVAGSLPWALRKLSSRKTGGFTLDVRLVLPLHRTAQADSTVHSLLEFPINKHGGEKGVRVYHKTWVDRPVYFISGDPISSSTGVYSLDQGIDQQKYVFFSIAALEMTRHLGWRPDIIHANDWHTALALYALLARRADPFFSRTAGLLTLHNLPYMGGDITGLLSEYGLDPISEANLPTWATTQPLPIGLWAADAVCPVSTTYAREILTPEFGCDLQGYLKTQTEKITGIINGLDMVAWDPAVDNILKANFDAGDLQGRLGNKLALQERVGLQVDRTTPLMAMVTRIDPQKGVDIAIDALRLITDLSWQFVILGTGDSRLEEAIRGLETEFPDRVRAVISYDANLGRLIYGGADAFLMPSRYEPCGLSQMIAMRYGCVPIVRATGGLKDTVEEGKTGFLFQKATSEELAEAIRRALSVYSNPEKWRRYQRNGMKQDFSWARSAQQYAIIYRSLYSRANNQNV
ncbi:MAG: glycogen/starch synthase [Chloroflexota bacterium]